MATVTLTEGTIRGRPVTIKTYLENGKYKTLEDLGLGDLVTPEEYDTKRKNYRGPLFTTKHPSRGRGRYIDRAWL